MINLGIGTIGENPALYAPFVDTRHSLGGQGQQVLYDLPLDHVFDPRVDISKFFGTPDFLWANDGNNPTEGPTLTLTGTPSVGATPYLLQDGTALESEVGSGSSNRKTTDTFLDLSAGQDMIIAAMIRTPAKFYGSVAGIIGTRIAGAGWTLRIPSANTLEIAVDNGGGVVDPEATIVDGSWYLVVGLVDGDGNTEISLNGATPVDPRATPTGGAIASGLGLSIFSRVDGTRFYQGAIAWTAAWIGAGIYDVWAAGSYQRLSMLAAMALGVAPASGVSLSTFARASSASWQNRNGVWHIASSGLPRCGDASSGGESGLRLAPSRTNKCYRNVDNAATTGYTASGGTLTVVNDSSQLETDGVGDWGPNVLRFVPGGSDETVRTGAATGNTNAHSLSIMARGAAGGETLHIGFRDSSSGVFTSLDDLTLTTSWQRFEVDGQTPGDTDEQWCIESHAGDTVYFVAAQLEEGAVCTSPIPNWATGAGASRSAETLTTPITPSDAKGKITFGITPLGWSSGDLGVACEIVERSGGTTLLVSIESGGAVEATDGTTTVGTQTIADGTRSEVTLTWGPGGLSLTVDGTTESVAYDGTLPQSGTFVLEASAAEVAIDSFRVYREAA